MDQLVIMCGGRGKRLKKNIPKALIKINNKTILEHQLILAKKHKFKKIILLTGYKSNEIKNFLIKKKLFRNITILRDKKKLGNGSAILNSIEHLEDHFCLIYGDILTNLDLSKMRVFFMGAKSDLSLVVNKNSNFQDSNLVTLKKRNLIKNFYLYPHKKIPKNCYSNEAIFMCKKKIFKIFKKKINNKKIDFVKDMISNLSNNLKIHAYITREYIIDCGTPERVREAKLHFKSNKKFY